jgi:hypothetical protein
VWCPSCKLPHVLRRAAALVLVSLRRATRVLADGKVSQATDGCFWAHCPFDAKGRPGGGILIRVCRVIQQYRSQIALPGACRCGSVRNSPPFPPQPRAKAHQQAHQIDRYTSRPGAADHRSIGRQSCVTVVRMVVRDGTTPSKQHTSRDRGRSQQPPRRRAPKATGE